LVTWGFVDGYATAGGDPCKLAAAALKMSACGHVRESETQEGIVLCAGQAPQAVGLLEADAATGGCRLP
jgi:hypothetical protein